MIYEYKCECGKVFEYISTVKDMKQSIKCSCGNMAKKLFSPTPSHFKVRGFPGNDTKKRSLGDQVVDNKVEDLFEDHNYGNKYGKEKDNYGLR